MHWRGTAFFCFSVRIGKWNFYLPSQAGQKEAVFGECRTVVVEQWSMVQQSIIITSHGVKIVYPLQILKPQRPFTDVQNLSRDVER